MTTPVRVRGSDTGRQLQDDEQLGSNSWRRTTRGGAGLAEPQVFVPMLCKGTSHFNRALDQEWLARRPIGADLFLEYSGRDSCVDGFHEVQNHMNHGLIAERRIDDSVVNGAGRPFDAEILLDGIESLAVHRIHARL